MENAMTGQYQERPTNGGFIANKPPATPPFLPPGKGGQDDSVAARPKWQVDLLQQKGKLQLAGMVAAPIVLGILFDTKNRGRGALIGAAVAAGVAMFAYAKGMGK